MATIGFHWVEPFLGVKLQNVSRGLENVTRTSIDIGLSSKWVKFQFRVIYPFYAEKDFAFQGPFYV